MQFIDFDEIFNNRMAEMLESMRKSIPKPNGKILSRRRIRNSAIPSSVRSAKRRGSISGK